MQKNIFSIIGGDKRNINLKYLLEEDGHTVKMYGFSKYEEEIIENYKDLQEAAETANYIIGGVPLTQSNGLITAPFSDTNISIQELLSVVKKEQTLIAGAINKEVIGLANEKGINILDILNYEEINLLNAIPTAFHKGV